jgi:hypothetical protein
VKTVRVLSVLSLALALSFQTIESTTAAEPPSRLISLDGVWQIAEGKMEQAPDRFDRSVPVPGLASLATPPFADPPGPEVADLRNFSQDGGRLLTAEQTLATITQKDPKRDAFWYRRTFRLEHPVHSIREIEIANAKPHGLAFGNSPFVSNVPATRAK